MLDLPSSAEASDAILPPELILYIISQLDRNEDKTTIAACSLIASGYRSLAQQRLFYSVFFSVDLIKSFQCVLARNNSTRASKFLRTIKDRPALAEHVRYIKTTFEYLQNPDPDEAEVACKSWFDILPRLTRLASFIINAPAGLPWRKFENMTKAAIETTLRSNTQYTLNAPNSFASITDACPLIDLSSLRLSRLRISGRVTHKYELGEDDNSATIDIVRTPFPWIGEVIKTIPIDQPSKLSCNLEIKISFENAIATLTADLPWSDIVAPVNFRWEDRSLIVFQIKLSDRHFGKEVRRKVLESVKRNMLSCGFGGQFICDNT
ncbi:hypothetical protein CVT24_009676 [Panaeolus cyanescens]|uniref:F-box domain-containing protein n=1 Tax=Panaeolus cyanescens TaxID=181874 RepID=A0A409Y9Z3_9AGAR|nr:hypothetical protein CVT24_009676 [Panaeolus cyanescens]